MKQYFVLANSAVRQRAAQAVYDSPDGHVVTIDEATRTLEQNAAQWPILEALSKQLQWPVNGELCWITPAEYKDILTAVFHQETVRLARGWNGGVVMLGRRTSKFKKGEFSDWIEFLHACAAERGVVVYPDEAINA